MATTSAGPWSVKGVNPKAREIAKDLARRSGMTLGEWLNRFIVESGAEPDAADYQAPLRDPLSGEGGGPSRRATASAQAPAGARGGAPRAADLSRIAEALTALSSRLEASEQRAALALNGVDQSVAGVLARLETVERDHGTPPGPINSKALEAALTRLSRQAEESGARSAQALVELREEVDTVAQRMETLEGSVAVLPEGFAEAAVVEDALARMATQLEQSEANARTALQSLNQSFAGLDARLGAAETRLSETDAGGVERRFETLAAELAEKVETGRAEIAERLRDAATGQFEKMESALRDLSSHVEQSERRSAHAIDRLGHEVLRVAQTLNGRVAQSEARSAEAVVRAGGEMARVAEAVEDRMNRAEQVQAEALERLGGEISRIAERLADRIAGSERRSAAAIDDIGQQVMQAADRIDQRYDKASSDLAERIRQSEDRTARLLDAARERFDQRLAGLPQREEPAASVLEPKAWTPEPAEMFAPETPSIPPAPVSVPLTQAAEPAVYRSEPEPFETTTHTSIGDLSVLGPDPFGPLPPLEPFDAFSEPTALFEEAPATSLHAAAPGVTETDDTAEHEGWAPLDAVVPPPEAEPARPLTTRELLESARSAARQAAAGPSGTGAGGPLDAAALARRFNINLPKLKRKEAGLTLRTAVVASGTAAAIAVTAVGAAKVYRNTGAARTEVASAGYDRGAPMAPLTPTAAPGRIQPSAGLDGAPMAALALTPGPAAGTPPGADRTAAPTHEALRTAAPSSAAALYESGVRRIESGDKSGTAQLVKAASLGLPEAQFYLAKLYESGSGGLRKDMTQARRWTTRAAQAGDVKAMHNLGLYYFEGEGGDKNVAAAASWFKRAAELGLQDSQYNLARLYQQGYGVGQNPAEAYKWYLVAAANGDAGARNDAQALRKSLGADEAAAAERSAAMLQQQAQAQAPAQQNAAAPNLR